MSVLAGDVPPPGVLPERQAFAETHFRGLTMGDVMRSLASDPSELSADTRKAITRGSPLAVSCAYTAIGRVRGMADIRHALEMEYRFTFRAMEHGDFIEGIRAAIIDKDRNPAWRHSGVENVPQAEVVKMLMPLGADRLMLENGEEAP